jgi:hypothetical protein
LRHACSPGRRPVLAPFLPSVEERKWRSGDLFASCCDWPANRLPCRRDIQRKRNQTQAEFGRLWPRPAFNFPDKTWCFKDRAATRFSAGEGDSGMQDMVAEKGRLHRAPLLARSLADRLKSRRILLQRSRAMRPPRILGSHAYDAGMSGPPIPGTKLSIFLLFSPPGESLSSQGRSRPARSRHETP